MKLTSNRMSHFTTLFISAGCSLAISELDCFAHNNKIYTYHTHTLCLHYRHACGIGRSQLKHVTENSGLFSHISCCFSMQTDYYAETPI